MDTRALWRRRSGNTPHSQHCGTGSSRAESQKPRTLVTTVTSPSSPYSYAGRDACAPYPQVASTSEDVGTNCLLVDLWIWILNARLRSRAVSRSAGQVFCRMSLNWYLSDVFLTDGLWLDVFRRKSTEAKHHGPHIISRLEQWAELIAKDVDLDLVARKCYRDSPLWSCLLGPFPHCSLWKALWAARRWGEGVVPQLSEGEVALHVIHRSACSAHSFTIHQWFKSVQTLGYLC
jgi:hypothetical protein